MSQLTNKKIRKQIINSLSIVQTVEPSKFGEFLIEKVADKLLKLFSQTISDTRREERKRIVKLFMSYPFEMLDFHDGDMKKAVFVKKKDLLDFLSKLQKKGEE